MSSTEASALALVRGYLQALQDGRNGEALASFFTPDAVQIELPNRLNPNGGTSDLPTLLRRSELGKQLLREQRYEIRSAVVEETRVAIEALWVGILAVPLDGLAAGATMRAHFAMFFELQDGRIRAQRNYDCFEPW